MAIDQLLMHYTSIVHNTSFTKVLGYVELCSGSGDGSFQKKQFPDLCKVNLSGISLFLYRFWELIYSLNLYSDRNDNGTYNNDTYVNDGNDTYFDDDNDMCNDGFNDDRNNNFYLLKLKVCIS